MVFDVTICVWVQHVSAALKSSETGVLMPMCLPTSIHARADLASTEICNDERSHIDYQVRPREITTYYHYRGQFHVGKTAAY